MVVLSATLAAVLSLNGTTDMASAGDISEENKTAKTAMQMNVFFIDFSFGFKIHIKVNPNRLI